MKWWHYVLLAIFTGLKLSAGIYSIHENRANDKIASSFSAADFEVGSALQDNESERLTNFCNRKTEPTATSVEVRCDCLRGVVQTELSRLQRTVFFDGLDSKKTDPKPVWASARRLGFEERVKQQLNPEEFPLKTIRLIASCSTGLPGGMSPEELLEEVKNRRAVATKH